MKRKEHIVIENEEFKECGRCKKIFELSEFRKDCTRWDGLYPYCKKCAKEKDNKTYRKNPERKYEIVLEYQRKTGLIRKYKPYKPEYYSSEKSKIKKAQRDLRRRILFKNANIKNSVTKNTKLELIKKYNGKCAYCGIDCLEKYHIEHKIPLSKGGENTIDNLALSCPNCNWSKQRKTDIEFCGHKV